MKQVIPGNNALTVSESGYLNQKIPHGTFYSLATQAIADVNNVQAIALEKDTDNEGFTHSLVTNNSRIYIPFSGAYELVFSGIADLAAAPANKHMHIFPAINGTPVTDSNTIVEIVTASIEMTVAVSYILEITAGQYLEMQTWGDSTNCQWLATAAGTSPTRPACPSIILTVKLVSSNLRYE